jgi:mono/diheme cytochrome c family protein
VVRTRRLPAVTLAIVITLELAGCGRSAAGPHSSGDPRAGLSVYKFEGCASCHALAGISVGTTGPPLDGEGGRRGASWLRAMLLAHLRSTGLRPLSARDLGDLVSYLTSLRR